jgi:nitroreductase
MNVKPIAEWRSIRKYKKVNIPDDILKKIIQAAGRAPSWENLQPWHFIIIRDHIIKTKLTELSGGQKFILSAPVIVACCGDLGAWNKEAVKASCIELRKCGIIPFSDEEIEQYILSNPMYYPALIGINTIIARTLEQLTYAISFLLLEARNSGIGACVVGGFGNILTQSNLKLYEELKNTLNLDENLDILTLITMGYPDENPPIRPRKKLDKILSFEKFGKFA